MSTTLRETQATETMNIDDFVSDGFICKYTVLSPVNRPVSLRAHSLFHPLGLFT